MFLLHYISKIIYKILNAEKYAKPKEVNGVERTKIITEYRQPGGNADGDNMVGMGWRWVQNILPCHPLLPSVMSALMSVPSANIF